jgi:Cytochrome c oxidase caa3 assembly factor (Caa3_CtaG)
MEPIPKASTARPARSPNRRRSAWMTPMKGGQRGDRVEPGTAGASGDRRRGALLPRVARARASHAGAFRRGARRRVPCGDRRRARRGVLAARRAGASAAPGAHGPAPAHDRRAAAPLDGRAGGAAPARAAAGAAGRGPGARDGASPPSHNGARRSASVVGAVRDGVLGVASPALYDLALRSDPWHHAEHACFFLTALACWRPIILPRTARASGPRWAMIVYLLLAEPQNTVLAAILTFSDRVIYPATKDAPRSHVAVTGDSQHDRGTAPPR